MIIKNPILMDGFSDAVNGYFDVEDQLSRYFLRQADGHFSAEQDEKRSIESRSDFEARRERVRDMFLSRIGGLPERSKDLSIETVDRHERDEYSIEMVSFESNSNFHVTSNCYVPDGNGPHPGILFLCGHLDDPKSDPLNQKACIELALNGFVVLIVDPIGQGERTQYYDSETGDPVFDGSGGVFTHCYAGQKCFYAGMNLARYMINDAQCALDYLHQRDDVDNDRIGVTGTSGGGTQTLYLSLVDDRIDAAAPCCSVTERREWLKSGKRIDAEQAIYGAIADGINYDDLITAMAPRPICIGAATSDEYFPIEGVRDAIDRTQRIYDLYDAKERVRLVTADRTHCSVYELRDGVFPWLCENLADSEYVSHDERRTLETAALQCTPRGSVQKAYTDERTIDDLIREDVAETHPNAGIQPTVDSACADELRQTLVETFDLDRNVCELSPRFIDQTTSDELKVERVWFKTERNPDIVVTGVLVSVPEPTQSPAIVLYERGTEELPERREEVVSLADEYGTVFVFDPRGVGAVKNRAIPIPWWVDAYDDIYGTEFKLAYDALQLKSSLLGMRVFDVLRSVAFLRNEADAERISFVGEGIGAFYALYAGAATHSVDRIDLHDLPPSFYEMTTGSNVPFHPQLTVFDVIGACDVPQLLTALDQRGVQVDVQ
nr:acetylxylan esterase [Halocatena marina]